VECVQ